MAQYRIEKSDDTVTVEVDGVSAEQQSGLLDAFTECQLGRCSCPTQEYRKLRSLHVRADDDRITLSLHAKEGEEIDTSEIQKCLDHTVAKVTGEERTDS